MHLLQLVVGGTVRCWVVRLLAFLNALLQIGFHRLHVWLPSCPCVCRVQLDKHPEAAACGPSLAEPHRSSRRRAPPCASQPARRRHPCSTPLQARLEVLDAETEGQLGYILELELNNALRGREVAALLTQVWPPHMRVWHAVL